MYLGVESLSSMYHPKLSCPAFCRRVSSLHLPQTPTKANNPIPTPSEIGAAPQCPHSPFPMTCLLTHLRTERQHIESNSNDPLITCMYSPVRPRHHQPSKHTPSHRPIVLVPPHGHRAQSQRHPRGSEHAHDSEDELLVARCGGGREAEHGECGAGVYEGVGIVKGYEGAEGERGVG